MDYQELYDHVGYYCQDCKNFVEYDYGISIDDPTMQQGYWCESCCPYHECDGCGEWVEEQWDQFCECDE